MEDTGKYFKERLAHKPFFLSVTGNELACILGGVYLSKRMLELPECRDPVMRMACDTIEEKLLEILRAESIREFEKEQEEK